MEIHVRCGQPSAEQNAFMIILVCSAYFMGPQFLVQRQNPHVGSTSIKISANKSRIKSVVRVSSFLLDGDKRCNSFYNIYHLFWTATQKRFSNWKLNSHAPPSEQKYRKILWKESLKKPRNFFLMEMKQFYTQVQKICWQKIPYFLKKFEVWIKIASFS